MPVRELCIHLTKRCNQACKHCYYEAGPTKEQELPVDVARDLILQCSSAGVRRVTLQGGEPLLYSGLEGLCRIAKARGMLVAIPTNGLLLSGRVADWMKDVVDIVFVSIHGREEFHDCFVKRPGAYRAAIQAIKNCQEADIRVGVLTSVSKLNAAEVEGLSRALDRLGVRLHGILYHTEVGRGKNIQSMDLREWDQFIHNMRLLQERFSNVRLRFETVRRPMSVRQTEGYTCSCLGMEKHICFVDSGGDIYPCSLAIGIPELCYGNVAYKRLSEYFEDMNWEWAYSRSPLSTDCLSCDELSVCHGGCMTKRFLNSEERCEKGRFLPLCYLYPDLDIYEEIIEGREKTIEVFANEYYEGL